MRLSVDGMIMEKDLSIAMDPRVDIASADLYSQRTLSMDCYNAYHTLQDIVEAIDSSQKPSKKMLELRGDGLPEEPDFMYGSTLKAGLMDIHARYYILR